MTAILSLLTGFRASSLFKPVMAFLGAVLLVLGIFWAGASWNDTKRDNQDLKDRIEAKEKADEITDEVNGRDDDDLTCGILLTCD